MKAFLFNLCLLFSSFIYAQVSVTATYTAGDQGLSGQGNFITTNNTSPCAATLNVNVPAGRFIIGVDVEYDLESFGNNWIVEQRSYLECVTTGNKEAALTSGSSISTAGLQSYARNNLTLANGLVGASGSVQFKLHGFRTFGSGCSTSDARIVNNTFKITVRHIAAPTCFAPTNLLATGITPTTVTLDWTTGGANNWQIEYGTPGFTPGTGTRVQVTSKPFLLTGLTSSTNYDFVVRDSCGATDLSQWSTSKNFRTACTAINAPYFENFESTDWAVSGFNSKGSIDTCWTRNVSNNFTWVKGLPSFSSNFTGPNGDKTTGTGKYIFSELVGFGGTTPLIAEIVSPSINVSSLTVPELSFWYHAFGTAMGDLSVEISTDGGQTFTSEFTLNGQQQTSKAEAWREAIIDLSGYANTTLQVKFKVTQPTVSSLGEFAIDDVRIQEAPTCPKPQNFAVENIWIDRASFSFTSSNASSWHLEYGTTGFTFGSGTRVLANSNPALLTGLSANTTYDVYLRSICGTGDSSLWVGPIEFTTFCNPTNAPYAQNFDNSSFTPGVGFFDIGTLDNCYQRSTEQNFIYKAGPSTATFVNSGPDKDHTTGSTTGKYIMSEVINTITQNTETFITTVPIDISSLTSPEVSFWLHMFGADIGGLEVSAITKSGETVLTTINGQLQNSKSASWVERFASLSSLTEDTVVIKFKAIRLGNSNNARISIDDVEVKQAASCPKPQALTVVGASQNTATLSWIGGGASNWQIEYGASGFVQGAGTLINVSTNPATISGLSPSTSYEFYVRDSCGTANVSLWSLMVSTTTKCAPVNAPFTENFDGTDFVKGGFTTPSTLNTCWQRDTGVQYSWEVGDNTTSSFGTGPASDHTSGSGQFLYTERIFVPNAAQNVLTQLESPLINCVPLTTPELQFWYHMFGNQIDSLAADVFDGATWTRVWGVSGQQQSSATDPWIEANVNLGTYTNDTISIRFRGYATTPFSFNNNLAIDDFSIREQPTCPKPSALSVTGNSGSSVTLSWTTGGATNWILEYGAPGFTKGTGTFVAVNSNPFTVTGLSGSSSYEFYLRDSCGAGDVSDWSIPVIGSTACVPLLAPYFEDFEATTFVRPALGVFADSGSFDVCWDRRINLSYFWAVGPPQFSSNFTGPGVDHTNGTATGKYAYTESAFGGATPFETELTTPPIDLTALNVPELSFWYHRFGTNFGNLEVLVSNGGAFTSVATVTGQTQSAKADAWLEQIIDLSAYANDTVRVRFKANKITTSTSADGAIDDIAIYEAPTCPKPTQLLLVNTTSTTATLSWTTGGATNWQIEYGSVGFSPGSGTLVNVNTNPATITGLVPNTVYDVVVRDSCGAGDVSFWSSKVSLRTACAPILAPYTQNFDGTDFTTGGFGTPSSIDPCWDRDDLVQQSWEVATGTIGFNSGPSGDHTTGNDQYMVMDRVFGTGFTQNREVALESPLISCVPLTTPELQFWYHMFGAQIDSLAADVHNGTTWTRVWGVAGQQQTSSNDAWLEANINLSSYTNDTIRVRFRAYSATAFSFANNIALDDFKIREQPTCPKPQNIVVSSTSITSVTLSWTSTAPNAIIEYGTTGFAKGTGTFVAANSNPFTVTGLTGGTTYDFYVRDSCGAGDVSDWAPVISASTGCIPLVAPYFEDFEGNTFVQPSTTIINDSGSFPVCWDRKINLSYFWTIGPPNFNPAFTGPSGDHTTGSGKYAYTESAFGGSSPFVTEIVTPSIDLSALNVPELTFWYHKFGGNMGPLTVHVSNGGNFTQVTSIVGQTQTTKAAPWLEEIVDLSAYANDTVRIMFRVNRLGFSTAADVAIDDIDIHETPSCPKPSNLNTLLVNPNSIQLGWTTGGATSWEIEYGPVGYTVGSGTKVLASTNPFTVNGLTPNTGYDFYVRDICGPNDTSDWFGPNPDTTACSIFTVPYTEDFEGLEWSSGVFTNDPGTISACYNRSSTTGYFWKAISGAAPGFNSGPSGDHTTGTGKFLMSEGFGTPTTNSTTILELPIVDISTVTNPEMRFWYHMFGSNIQSLKLDGWNANTNTWQQLTIINGAQQSAKTDAWIEQVVDLSPLPKDTIALRFVAERTGFGVNNDMGIDDIWIGQTPSCTQPTNLSFVSATTTSIDISWTSGGAANSLIKYRPSGSTGPFTFVGATGSSATISGLMPSTSYDIYLADSCGLADISLYLGPLQNATLCGNASLPYSQDFSSSFWKSGTGFFNTGDDISPCWNRASSTTTRWSTRLGATSSFNSGPNSGVNGKYIVLVSTTGNQETVSVESENISIPASATTPKLYFYYHMFGNNIDSLSLQVNSGGTWSANLWSKAGAQQSAKTDAWIQDSVDLSAYLGNTIKFRFVGKASGFACNMAIDEVSISEPAAPCTAPTGLSLSNITASGADVTWTSVSGNSNIFVTLAGQPISAGTAYYNVTSPFTISGLMANSAYDVYVQDSCGASSLSNNATISLTTSPCPVIVPALTINASGLNATFDANATTNADSVYIEFGDGNSSSLLNSTNLYATAGTYTISLFAFNDCGNADSLFDTLTVCEPLVNAFTFTQSNSTFTFDGSTSIGATGYLWNFGDGNNGAGASATHTYTAPGNYTVVLQVFNNCGDTLSTSQVVSVCVKPEAKWTYTIVSTTGAGMLVSFDATASTNAINFEWTFGDGNSASGTAVPTNLYLVPSLNYTVRCIAKNACGGSDTLAYKLNEIGLEESALNELVDVYPIPTDNTLFIEYPSTIVEIKAVQLLDASGALIMQNKVAKNLDKILIDVKHLPQGLYFLKLETDKGVLSKKVKITR